ncbi:hypothetical protein NS226_03665 [Aureimonas ureilytica]|uniref:Endonuclease/exonuclease/phosphatase domain-containing protein n=1 Tax=Aureimonas ureilytica TaxID=401562 RepID=A0A175RD93_9HYPH|nr:endonuclease/exonuclease/phosphatase family protein [Aureimonas ureilytica]KTQ97753.1 hypothetical protein NS226_03665 [Aureimonas ureilytica]
MSASGAIRIATWNIHGFFGEGRRPDFERTIRCIRAMDADILALQEVDGRTHLRREPFAFERLAEALGDHFAPAPLFGRTGREYGHALWSRFPLADVAIQRLPGPGFEPRAVIDARAQTPLGPLRLLSLHLGLRPAARRAQADAVAALVEPGEASVVLGDFNEWRSGGPVDRCLRRVLPEVAHPPSWPARRPLVPMDRLYASRTLRLSDIRAWTEAAPASDHLPVVATLRRA